MQKAVYIVDGARSPFLKMRNRQGDFSASDLATQVGRALLKRQPISIQDIDEMVIGCVMPQPHEANIARVIALRLGAPERMPAYTVQRNCASGMQAIDNACQDILMGRANLVLAGGTEAMSQAPVMYSKIMANWFMALNSARSVPDRIKTLLRWRPAFLKPIFTLMVGLTDPLVNLSMGQTAENLIYRFGITRQQLDEFSAQSHERVSQAQVAQAFSEIVSIFSDRGDCFQLDDGVRADTTVEKLGQLKAFFDKKFGTVTAGNSSQISDGSALLLLASEKAVQQYQLPVLAKISACAWAGVSPSEMGLGPVMATQKLLQENQLSSSQIDYWEINEAFAGQVLACTHAMRNAEFCKTQCHSDQIIADIPNDRLNIDGGAVALGHPVGASGARIVLHLAHILRRTQTNKGIASICIGGGQGGAMLIERV